MPVKKKETPTETITRLRRENLELKLQVQSGRIESERLKHMLEFEKRKNRTGKA